MDTKWKNSHRLGILMMILTIAAGTSLALASYPWLREQLFAVPAEMVGFLGVMATCVVGGCMRDLVWMVICSASGELKWEIMQELYVGDTLARIMVFTMNAFSWAFGLFVFYWLTVCVLSPFRLGIRRWFMERTLCGRLIVWGRKCILRLCDQIQKVDLRDKPTKLLLRIVAVNFLVLSLMICFWFFGIFGILIYSVGLFVLLRRIWNRMQAQYEVLLEAAGRMAEGDLEVEITEELGVFEPLKGEIARIRNGFKKAVEEEVCSRSMKTELITNVSHDLKTPLTAIITYVNLLKNPELTPEERDSYIQVLDQKSMRLKGRIEDLFEISKADSNNVSLNLMEVDVVAVMKEARLELALTGDEMTGRFVRGDASRNTEGSGLGLAIAKSFTRLQKGTMTVDVDGDLFKVMIVWEKGQMSESENKKE